MRKYTFFLLLCFYLEALGQDTLWVNANTLEIEGKGFSNTENDYDRLPATAKGLVRDPVWELGQHSAGILVRFYTNALQFYIRWELTSTMLAMPHMPATGVSGVDVYVLNNKKEYLFLGTGIPKNVKNLAVFNTNTQQNHLSSYLLYLPLYNGTKLLEIGVPMGYVIQKDTIFHAVVHKPILFYGTSILQGACASRAGMAYPSILGRKLGVHIINLGFSGNAKLEPEMQELISEVEAAVYVIDCHHNTTKDETQTRTEPAIRKIRAKRPYAPIVLIEGSNPKRDFPTEEGLITQEIVKKLKKEGFKNLYYIKGNGLLGQDTEATVDLVHHSDLGMQRQAEFLYPIFKKILRKIKQ
ncbi:MAG: SGNH/GDSL hydrolase family protein [Thermoflexibacter sp.]|uniref:N-terminus of Esterase_SGNH_hydro-type n=1 Tax=Thermoflexibacter ruber TaxID=1003 RepID=A0A1I2ITU5_9BACT|nr:SGNH/GDSL hydrolase family protein [Thermoflexibacter ruber]SFF45689.1 N-terminus of Esterase_SGNH_hydro-type [Thermoflexibacter ruber]